MAEGYEYPILLSHGMGFRDDRLVGYWGRIPCALEAMGCRVYFGGQDSSGTVETNAAALARRIREILAETGADKLHIIAHSKGGMDARYAISSLGMAPFVASLTTLATPHHGSRTVDLLMKLPMPLIRFAAFCADLWSRFLGDRHPDCLQVFQSFTTRAAQVFNAANPDQPGVVYSSYAFVMKSGWSDLLLWLPHLVVKKIEGENDGLLPPAAVQWGSFHGIVRGAGRRGVSHCDEIDLRRRPLAVQWEDGSGDLTEFYCAIARSLYS